jgi:hypothetical protein
MEHRSQFSCRITAWAIAMMVSLPASAAFATDGFFPAPEATGTTECPHDPPEIDPFHPPLYWSVYEYHFTREQQGVQDNYISEADLWTNILWLEDNLLAFGYDMVAMDGWGDLTRLNEHGYRMSHSRHWNNDYAWWACHLRGRGLHLGMYDNPLWVHMNAVNNGATVVGTDIPLADIIDPDEQTLWFTWVQVDRDGAEEYVKGNIQHWAEMGIRFLNVDFLSWFEDGFDKNMGDVGPARPKEHYQTAMKWMFEAAKEHGVLLKAVMPHLNNEAEVEREFSHMFRINEDVWTGGWEKFSESDRGQRRPWWSQWANPMDGYAYWSQYTGRNDVTLCGDFIRLNTFDNDRQRQSVISQHLVAGGPVGVADQHSTIGDHVWLYQNQELLALNYDGFAGRPMSHDPADPGSQIWTGRMSDGDWIVAMFNRENATRTRNIDFSGDLEGFPEDMNGAVRDLWMHLDLGVYESYSADVPSHGVRVLRIFPTDEPLDDREPPYLQLWMVGDAVPAGWNIASPDEMSRNPEDPWQFSFESHFSEGEFKIATFTGDWCDEHDWIRPQAMHPPLSETGYVVTTGCPPSEEDYKWLIADPGFYRVVVDLYEETIEIALATSANDYSMTGNQARVPHRFGLNQNYPNPFNSATMINFDLPEAAEVTLEVFDVMGRLVEVLVYGHRQAGSHESRFDATGLSSGTYILHLRAGAYSGTRTLMLIK